MENLMDDWENNTVCLAVDGSNYSYNVNLFWINRHFICNKDMRIYELRVIVICNTSTAENVGECIFQEILYPPYLLPPPRKTPNNKKKLSNKPQTNKTKPKQTKKGTNYKSSYLLK